MLRSMTIVLALSGLMAAAPMRAQPAPASVPPKAEASAPKSLSPKQREEAREAKKREEAMEAAARAAESRNKAFDARMKKTMSGVCSRC